MNVNIENIEEIMNVNIDKEYNGDNECKHR